MPMTATTPFTRFERRLYVGFAVLVLLFTPVLVGAFIVISELEATQGDLLSKNAQDVIQAERLSSLLHEETALVQGFVLRGDPSFLHQVDQVHQHFQLTATHLLEGVELDESPALLQELKSIENQNYARIGTAAAMKAKGASLEDLNRYFESGNVESAKRAVDLVEENVRVQNSQLHQARDYVNRTSKRLVLGLILACAFALAATAGIIFLLYQMIRAKAEEDRQKDERLRLESQLSSARKEAVEVVAHDLKNPLSSLKMALELLASEISPALLSPEHEEASLAIQIANRSIQSMQRLIDETLDHTKIEAGQLVLEKSLKNVTELLKDVEFRFRPLFEQKQIEFTTRFERALFAEIDAARMEQVISNLLGNALKFTPSQGHVQLTCERAPASASASVSNSSEIILKVKDNGPGISSEARAHIFERYYQVKENAKKGTGLGLAIAKGIVEAHGGRLQCVSELGAGTQFEVAFRAAEFSLPTQLSH